MKADQRDRISTELKELESNLKAKGANPEEFVRERIIHFEQKGLDSDVFRKIYSVKNPSSELKQLIKQIESHDLCSELISKL